jgi:hypothetical protein
LLHWWGSGVRRSGGLFGGWWWLWLVDSTSSFLLITCPLGHVLECLGLFLLRRWLCDEVSLRSSSILTPSCLLHPVMAPHALSSGLFETDKIWAVFSRRGVVVLSSEASEYVSATDRDIVQSYGIAGIECSWSRDLKKFPSSAWKKGRNQRLMHSLIAANTVNYGRRTTHKLNTTVWPWLRVCSSLDLLKMVAGTFF